MKRFILSIGLAVCMTLSYSQDSHKEHHRQRVSEITAKISKEPGNLTLYYARADVYDALNDFTSANRDYNKVLSLYRAKPDTRFSGEFAKSCYRLADDYFFRKSDKKQALSYVREGLEIMPDFKDLEILEAVILGSISEKREQALEKFKAATAKYSKDIRLSLFYARFLQSFDPLAAAQQYEKVLAADPLNKESVLALGTIYNNEANRLSSGVITDPQAIYDYAKKASEYFERAHKMFPNDREIANVLITLYTEMDENDLAEKMRKNLPY